MTMTTDPLSGLAPEARVRLEVFWEIVKRMNPASPTEWDAAREQALLTESMILEGVGSRTPARARAWKPVAPDLVAIVERMAKAGKPTAAIRRETGLEPSTIRTMVRRNGWRTDGPIVAKPAAAPVEPKVPHPSQARTATAGKWPPKLSDADLAVIRSRVEAGERQADIAKDYGVTEAAIYHRARNGGWNVPVRRKVVAAVSRETSPAAQPAGLSGNGIATKNKIRAAALAAGVGVDRAPVMQTVDAAAVLRGAGHRVTRLPLEGKWRVDDREPVSLPELERMARQVAP